MKICMARILCLLLVLLSLVGFCGCGSPLIAKWDFIQNATDEVWEAEYARLDGEIQHKMTAPQNATALRVVFTTEEGEVALTVTDAAGGYLYRGNNLGSVDFTVGVAAKETVTVTVTVTATDHKGKFSFTFE